MMNKFNNKLPDPLLECTTCPRNCRVNRTSSKLGFCKTGVKISTGSICAHRGEEPVISGTHGICNIFFTHCNMQCLYCQNYDISRNTGTVVENEVSIPELVDRIEEVLKQGSKSVGFVSPSHYVIQMLQIIDEIKRRGHNPVFVYNTNGYDKKETIENLEGIIDVYLPDFKYMDEQLGRQLSDTPDYPKFASAAIGEMYRQKGAEITLDDEGLITSGLIIRHLVLPGYTENSINVLNYIAENFSNKCYISLMSQYYPTPRVTNEPFLNRRLKPREYDEVLDEFDKLGFENGWVQDMNSADNYRPDFLRNHPFEQ
ncbi:MAG: radical SAM protein [bacterium]